MKILVTGATGFLGKRVVELLAANERVSRIFALSRRALVHPNPKVSFLQCDLSKPSSLSSVPTDVGAIVHLAGRYVLSDAFGINYLENVVATQHLIHWVQASVKNKKARFHHASTYAVGWGVQDGPFQEAPLTELPPKSQAYALSKAITEGIITQSSRPYSIYRLGILVGDSAQGQIDRIDGPYYFMRLLRAFAQIPKIPSHAPLFVPASPDTILPFVPVDIAAAVIVEGALRNESGPSEIYGVYDPASTSVRTFVEACISRYRLRKSPLFIQLPDWALEGQSRITGVPAAAFRFASQCPELRNDVFRKRFGTERIPDFNSYKTSLFDGFETFSEGIDHVRE